MKPHTLIAVLRGLLVALGILLLLLTGLAFTPAPFYMHRSLGTDPAWQADNARAFRPDYVVMFGGAGMPSEGNLMRLYYTAGFARRLHCPVVLVHPKDSLCQAEMTRFLTNYGLAPDSILYMTAGSNTRSQALCLADSMPQLREASLLVVTAPEHLARTLRCMRKCGMTDLRGIGAFEGTVDFDLRLDRARLGGKRIVPDVESTSLRYTFWNYLKLEITCLREYLATAYYRLKGWV